MSKTLKTKEAKIEVRVTPEFKEELQKKAKEADMSLSQYVITLIEHSSVVILKDSAKFAKELSQLRIALEENGFSRKAERTMQALILAINEMIDSLPQNRSDLCEEPDDTSIDPSDNDDEDFEDEEWEEGGDLI